MIPDGLAKESWMINNPALGAYMLWICALSSFSTTKEAIHPSKLFCLFAFIFYSDTRSALVKNRGTLQSYITSFSSTKSCATDVALSIHTRINEQKEKTLNSLIIACDTGLMTIDSETGLITPNTEIKPIAKANIDNSLKELISCSEKLGRWLSNLTTQDLMRITKVVY